MGWVIASAAASLTPDAVLGVEVGGERIVLWRDATGAPAALADRCAHMPLPLSAGRCVEGRLQCRHHGLEYDAEGSVVAVFGCPIKDDRRVKPYPTKEADGQVWVWIGAAEDASA